MKYEQAQFITTHPSYSFSTDSEWGAARASCPVIISLWGVDGFVASAYIAGAPVLGDYRAQLHVEEEPEMKANCFQDLFHIKH